MVTLAGDPGKVQSTKFICFIAIAWNLAPNCVNACLADWFDANPQAGHPSYEVSTNLAMLSQKCGNLGLRIRRSYEFAEV